MLRRKHAASSVFRDARNLIFFLWHFDCIQLSPWIVRTVSLLTYPISFVFFSYCIRNHNSWLIWMNLNKNAIDLYFPLTSFFFVISLPIYLLSSPFALYHLCFKVCFGSHLGIIGRERISFLLLLIIIFNYIFKILIFSGSLYI